jgi:hypothetical protein
MLDKAPLRKAFVELLVELAVAREVAVSQFS